MKKNIVAIVIASLLCLGAVHYMPRTYISYDTTIDKDNPTVEQIYNLLNNHFHSKNLKLQPGSPAYIEQLVDLLMFEDDKELKENPYYEEIKIYASNYITESKMYERGSLTDIFKVYDAIPKSMKNKTIKELSDGK